MSDTNSANGSQGEESSGITRRSTLKSLGGGIMLSNIAATGLGSEEKVRITTVKVGDEPRERKEVPKQWWEREQAALAVQKKLRERFGTSLPGGEGVSGIDGVGLGTLDERVGDRHVSSVEIYTTPEVLTDVALPQEMDGVPVKTQVAQFAEPNDCNQGDFDNVPGGVQVEEDKLGTSTCKVEYNGSPYLMTAYHLFGCGSDPTNNKMYQSGQYVGKVRSANIKQDWVLVEQASDSQINGFDNSIADQVGPVAGRVTKQGLMDLKSNGTTVYMQGVSSCEESGQVTKIDKTVTTCHDWTSQYYVELSTPTVNGDSGGPHFKEYTYNHNTYLGLIAPHYGGESVGCAAYKIHDDTGIKFNPS